MTHPTVHFMNDQMGHPFWFFSQILRKDGAPYNALFKMVFLVKGFNIFQIFLDSFYEKFQKKTGLGLIFVFLPRMRTIFIAKF